MKNLISVGFIFFVVTLLAGCAAPFHVNDTAQNSVGSDDSQTRQVLGHNTEILLGKQADAAAIGHLVRDEMQKYDREELNHVYERGTPNLSSCWINPDTGNQFAVIPQPVYLSSQGTACRKAEIIADLKGKKERLFATACRERLGHWKIL